jgi:predicted dehydrogenase
MIEAAIVGLGRWGRAHIDAASGSERLRFVHAVDPSSAARTYAEGQGIRSSGEFERALRDRAVKAVVLATPHSMHRAQVVAAAAAGKHVFCEKPFALREEDARAMVEACARAGVALAVGHNRRFWPAMRELARIVAGGSLGRVLHVEGHNSNENSNRVTGGWRTLPGESPGGGMTGAGLHALDAFIGLCGPVRSARAMLLEHRKEIPPLDTLSVLYEFESGASGTLATVRATPLYWRIHVFGTEGSAEALGETELVLRMSGKPLQRLQLDPVDSVRAELEAFADAAQGRSPYPVPPGQILATVAAFEKTLRSLTAA